MYLFTYFVFVFTDGCYTDKDCTLAALNVCKREINTC